MLPFHALFPDVARDECRTVTLLAVGNPTSRTFLFVEFYCNEPACDCRRVILNVIDTGKQQHVATINHAFEPPKPPFEDEGQTFLDPLNPQSPASEELLDLFKGMIAGDAEYRARLERHYQMWKTVVDDPAHPDHAKVRSKFHDDPSFSPAFRRQEPVRREGPRVGPNDPCPCGSGKKYKRCCRA
jgi:hypothetical protein